MLKAGMLRFDLYVVGRDYYFWLYKNILRFSRHMAIGMLAMLACNLQVYLETCSEWQSLLYTEAARSPDVRA